MSEIVTRAGAGVPLTYTQVDSNFTNLNDTKLESAEILAVAGTATTTTTITGVSSSSGIVPGMRLAGGLTVGETYVATFNPVSGVVTLSGDPLSGTGSTTFDYYPVLYGAYIEAAQSLTVLGDASFSGNVTINGTTTNINTTNLVVEDKNIILGDVASPSNTTANGGGITLEAGSDVDKTIIWDSANTNWTSSEHWNIATGKSFKINNTSVLNATTLGSGVTGSSLTSVGTLSSLTVSGNLTIDTNTLFVNATTNRVGIGTASPATSLDITFDSAVDNTGLGLTFTDNNASYTSHRFVHEPNGGFKLLFDQNNLGPDPVEMWIGPSKPLTLNRDGTITTATPGATDNSTKVATTAWVRNYGGRQDATVYLSGSGTVAFPTGVTKARVTVVGGGGAGGGSPAVIGASGSGGAGGNTVIRYLTGITGSYTYSVGAGGSGVSNANGGAGSSSTFVCTDASGAVSITAGGGGGGLVGVANIMVAGGAPSGTFTGGDIALRGIPGIAAHYHSGTGGQSSSGDGGGGYMGAGGGNGQRATSGTTLAGIAGQNGTGGGGGGGTNFTAVVATGGNGGTGIIILEY